MFEKNFTKESKVMFSSDKEIEIRSSPAYNSKITRKLRSDKEIFYIKSRYDWSKIRSGFYIGWVENKDLKFKSNMDRLAKILSDNEKLFTGTDVNKTVTAELDNSEIVEVMFTNMKWTKIKTLSGKIGWVKKASITKNVSEEDVNNYITSKILEYENENNQKAQVIIEDGLKYLNTKYLWGGTSPEGFDCSGFVKYLFQQRGISMNRVACDQTKNGVPIPDGILKKGDLLFFDTNKTNNLENNVAPSNVSHVGIYLGNKKFLHSSSGAGKVVVSDLSAYYRNAFVTARRLV
jgi:cell wall-associated NlpC family hydrolase